MQTVRRVDNQNGRRARAPRHQPLISAHPSLEEHTNPMALSRFVANPLTFPFLEIGQDGMASTSSA
jgi:hypothetical protein